MQTNNKQEELQLLDEIKQEEPRKYEEQLEMLIKEMQQGERIMNVVRFFGVLALVAIFIIVLSLKQ
mgnify:CR=1 FL=1